MKTVSNDPNSSSPPSRKIPTPEQEALSAETTNEDAETETASDREMLDILDSTPLFPTETEKIKIKFKGLGCLGIIMFPLGMFFVFGIGEPIGVLMVIAAVACVGIGTLANPDIKEKLALARGNSQSGEGGCGGCGGGGCGGGE